MKLTRTARAAIGALAALTIVLPAGADAARSGSPDVTTDAPTDVIGGAAAAVESVRSSARFEGRTIDMSKDWEEATACWVDEVGAATCYRSEAEMDRALVAAGHEIAEPAEAQGMRASCSSSIRLYWNTNYGGSVLYLSQQGTWLTLSWYGFDNVTSSYKIGSCSSTFRSLSYGGGSTYWGNTSAWSWASSMGSWDNVTSSIYIY